MPPLPTWLTLVNGVIGGIALGLILWLWLNGTLQRSKDCADRVAALNDSHAIEITLVQSAHADALTALNLAHDNRVKLLLARLDAVVADRDAWRDAHNEEAAARRAAESATRQLMESGNIAMELLSALKDSMAHNPPGGAT